jgi:hypothetical protein
MLSRANLKSPFASAKGEHAVGGCHRACRPVILECHGAALTARERGQCVRPASGEIAAATADHDAGVAGVVAVQRRWHRAFGSSGRGRLRASNARNPTDNHAWSGATVRARVQDFGYLLDRYLDIPLGSAWYSCRLAREPLVIIARS